MDSGRVRDMEVRCLSFVWTGDSVDSSLPVSKEKGTNGLLGPFTGVLARRGPRPRPRPLEAVVELVKSQEWRFLLCIDCSGYEFAFEFRANSARRVLSVRAISWSVRCHMHD